MCDLPGGEYDGFELGFELEGGFELDTFFILEHLEFL